MKISGGRPGRGPVGLASARVNTGTRDRGEGGRTSSPKRRLSKMWAGLPGAMWWTWHGCRPCIPASIANVTPWPVGGSLRAPAATAAAAWGGRSRPSGRGGAGGARRSTKSPARSTTEARMAARASTIWASAQRSWPLYSSRTSYHLSTCRGWGFT